MLEPLSSDYALEIGKMSKDSNFRVVEMVKMGVSDTMKSLKIDFT